MRKCNICGNSRPEVWYKTKNKKTCRSCERGWRGYLWLGSVVYWFRFLVENNGI